MWFSKINENSQTIFDSDKVLLNSQQGSIPFKTTTSDRYTANIKDRVSIFLQQRSIMRGEINVPRSHSTHYEKKRNSALPSALPSPVPIFAQEDLSELNEIRRRKDSVT